MSVLEMITALPLSQVETSNLKEHHLVISILSIMQELQERLPGVDSESKAYQHCRELIKVLDMMRFDFSESDGKLSETIRLIEQSIGYISNISVYRKNAKYAMEKAYNVWWPYCIYGKKGTKTDIYYLSGVETPSEDNDNATASQNNEVDTKGTGKVNTMAEDDKKTKSEKPNKELQDEKPKTLYPMPSARKKYPMPSSRRNKN